jgi:hypothetical protein
LTHVATKELAVAEDAEEVGDEEGAKHEDGGQQGRVGIRPVPVLFVLCALLLPLIIKWTVTRELRE